MERSLLSFCLFMVSVLTWAQDPGEKDTVKTEVLGEVVVSANRWEQNVREVPGTISKIEASLVQFQNPQTAADLLNTSGRVFIQKSQLGGGSPMLRGFSTNRVLLVVDGVRMNNAIFRSGNVQNVISLDAHAIAEAEVIFGPGSVIYGSDAIGGVMDFHTLRPKLYGEGGVKFSPNVSLRYSSANAEKTFHTDFNIGTKKWAFLTSITRSDYGNLMMGSHGPDEYLRKEYVVRENGADVIKTNDDPQEQVPSGYDQFNALQKIRFMPSASFDITYSFHYSKTSDYARYDRLTRRRNGVLRSAEWYYGPQQWIMHAVNVRYYANKGLFDQAALVAAYQDYEESRHDRNLNADEKTNQLERVQALSFNLDMDKTFRESISFYYGAEFVHNKVGSRAFTNNILTNEKTGIGTRYPDGAVWSSFAFYLSAKIRLSNAWLLTVSNRFTNIYTQADFDTTFYKFPFTQATLRNRATNSSVGLVYTPNDNWKVYVNGATGFRAPNVDDIGKVFDSGDGNVIVPNPDLEPELAYSIEAGAAAKIAKGVYVDAAVYYSTIKNAIARGYSTFNGQDSIEYNGELGRVLSQQNISEMYVYGLQAGIRVSFADYLTLTSDINFQKGKERDPETNRNFAPTHVAPMFGSTHLIYSNKKLKADLYAVYNGKIGYRNLALTERADAYLYAADKNGNPWSPSWLTVNLKGSYTALRWLTIDAGVENMTNLRYRPYSSGITAPGRNFITTVRARF
jgi:hemoglobin/transferrin/lactoferrin receptor protein